MNQQAQIEIYVKCKLAELALKAYLELRRNNEPIPDKLTILKKMVEIWSR